MNQKKGSRNGKHRLRRWFAVMGVGVFVGYLGEYSSFATQSPVRCFEAKKVMVPFRGSGKVVVNVDLELPGIPDTQQMIVLLYHKNAKYTKGTLSRSIHVSLSTELTILRATFRDRCHRAQPLGPAAQSR